MKLLFNVTKEKASKILEFFVFLGLLSSQLSIAADLDISLVGNYNYLRIVSTNQQGETGTKNIVVNYHDSTIYVNASKSVSIHIVGNYNELYIDECIHRDSLSTIGNYNETFYQRCVSPPICSYSISPMSYIHGAMAESNKVIVTTSNSNCSWNASSNVSWANITSGKNGISNGMVIYSVQANNNSTVSRSGILTIAGQTFTISQLPLQSYVLTLNKTGNGQISGGGSFSSGATVNLTATPDTGWSFNSWSPSPCNSSFQMPANDLTCTATFSQGCNYSLNPTFANHSANAENGNFNITVINGCNWTANSNQNWVKITNPSGSGNAIISYSIDANPNTTARSAIISINGQSFTVNQAAKTVTLIPDIRIEPTTLNF